MPQAICGLLLGNFTLELTKAREGNRVWYIRRLEELQLDLVKVAWESSMNGWSECSNCQPLPQNTTRLGITHTYVLLHNKLSQLVAAADRQSLIN